MKSVWLDFVPLHALQKKEEKKKETVTGSIY